MWQPLVVALLIEDASHSLGWTWGRVAEPSLHVSWLFLNLLHWQADTCDTGPSGKFEVSFQCLKNSHLFKDSILTSETELITPSFTFMFFIYKMRVTVTLFSSQLQSELWEVYVASKFL